MICLRTFFRRQYGSDRSWKSRDDDLRAIAAQFLDIVSPYAIIFSGLSIVVSFCRSWLYGWYLPFLWHLCIYAVALAVVFARRRLPVSFVVLFLLGLMSLDVLQSLIINGLAGAGIIGLTVLCIIAGIFTGIKGGAVFIAAGLAMTGVLGALVSAGIVTPEVPDIHYLVSPIAWVSQISAFLMYAIPLVVTAHILRQRMSRSVQELREMNERLRSEISLRRQAEGDSRDNLLKYRNILEHMSEGIFDTAVNGRLIAVNRAFVEMAGYATPDEMMTHLHDGLGALIVRRQERERLDETLSSGGDVLNLELEIVTRDSHTVWLCLNMHYVPGKDDEPPHYEGMAQDITKRKKAEIALQQSEIKYRSVVENSFVASYIVQDGFFRFVNSAFSTITGYSRRELTEAMRPSDIIHSEDRRMWEKAISGIIGGQQDRLELELRIGTKGKTSVVVKALAGTTSYHGRTAIFGTFIDVSKEKALEGELRQAQKMEAVGTLAGGIAHDFNNILTALTGYATLLHMRMKDGDELKYYVDQIFSASQKATTLTERLLTFGRKQPVYLQPIEVGTILRGAESVLRRLITEDISLVMGTSDERVIIMADSGQIDQILFNLATNARDAMPEGGRLTISTQRVFLGEDFISANGFGKAGDYAKISVSDTGFGMDDATKERIFDPFFTTKELGKGTGLGLSTVYGIVKQHKGYVCVSSAPLQGTTFSIYLPLTKTTKEVVRPTVFPDMAMMQKGSETILVADDNPEVRRFVKDMLDHCGYRVIEATDGEDAVNAFMNHDDISLVVLDSVMPRRNGRQAYEAMKAAKSDLKALFISGYTKDTILDKGIKEGEMDFMEKPLVPARFLKKVEEIIARP